MKTLLVIPARYDSSRLPGKPLVDIAGVPMIVRTFRQCARVVATDSIIVATDDERIRAVCEAEGIPVLMTSGDCLTGTDRVAEVAASIPADVYVNVQGDEPVFAPGDLEKFLQAVERHPEEVLNAVCPLSDENQFRSPSVPKVVMRPDGRLLYMSRAAIPTSKTLAMESAWRQVCVYGFPRAALLEFSAAGRKTSLEAIEDIEILRFLEMGWEVRMVELSDRSISVDHPEDVERVVERLRSEEQAR